MKKLFAKIYQAKVSGKGGDKIELANGHIIDLENDKTRDIVTALNIAYRTLASEPKQ